MDHHILSKRNRLVDKLISLLVRRGATEKNSEIIHAEIIAASIEMVDLYRQSLQTGSMNQDEYRELQIAIHVNAERHRNAVAELKKSKQPKPAEPYMKVEPAWSKKQAKEHRKNG